MLSELDSTLCFLGSTEPLQYELEPVTKFCMSLYLCCFSITVSTCQKSNMKSLLGDSNS